MSNGLIHEFDGTYRARAAAARAIEHASRDPVSQRRRELLEMNEHLLAAEPPRGSLTPHQRESIFIEACFTTREDEWGLESPGVPRRASRAAAWLPWGFMLVVFLLAVVR